MSTPWTETSVAVAQTYRFSTSVSEIEEEEDGNFSSELFEINHGEGLASIKEEDASSLFSFDVNNAEDIVYVAVGKSESSIGALSWTLSHFVNTSSVLYLIHVFPEIHHIPSPLGMLPKSKVSPSQVENYMAQERGKRRELLQKFLNICSASKVTVDTMLIESDMVAKAILDLIPILNIRKLVVGTSNCSPRKLKSRRGIGIADQIFQNAPDTCEVKVVCEGKEVITSQMIASPSASAGNEAYFKALQKADHNSDSFSCMCFRPKF
ncbi:U-box domain-containing protein 35 isoform X2 [Herrania umbratica]|uniref:U-box domain-containing protein 35 isoform X2 n=1 Tax=Herrania umbratica TaxID=108875 RepID=A0A6J1B3F8_9ROSI|nr:U-box domain-containing protein 35 isoform X2 [Herrania umbratica]